MTVDTTELRRLAMNATQGPWEWCCWDNDSFEIVSGGFDSEGRVIGSTVVQPDASDEEGYGGVKRREDADYISAANPATVLALLDEMDNNRKAMNAAKNVIKSQEQTISALRDKTLKDKEAATTLDSEREANAALTEEIDRLRAIEAAARNMAKVKGRHNSEIAMNRLLETLK